MRKIFILGFMISLLNFGVNKNEVTNTYAAKETSATFFESSVDNAMEDIIGRNMANGELKDYATNIINIKVSNKAEDLPSETDRICNPIKIEDCVLTDASGIQSVPTEGIIFAYISKISNTTDNKYNCVLYADVDKIYANANATGMFSGFSALEAINLTMLDTSKTTNFSYFLENCEKLQTFDLKTINTSSATDINHMFSYCKSLTSLDFSSFNTSSVTDMNSLFFYCVALTDVNLGTIDTANVTNMLAMFNGCTALTEINVSNFNTEKVTRMGDMFALCSSLTKIDVSNFVTTNVTDLSYMFSNCTALTELNLSNFDTRNVQIIRHMFIECSALRVLDISSFDLSNANQIQYMLLRCNGLEKIKLPNVLPTDSNTNEDHALEIPEQFEPYYGINKVTTENLNEYSTLNIQDKVFIKAWKTLREEGGAEGICAALVKGTTGNATLIRLLSDYDSFENDIKNIINETTDIEGVTIGESIRYVKSVLNGSQTTEKDYGITQEVSSPMINLDETTPVIAIFSISVIAMAGFYLYSKKKAA